MAQERDYLDTTARDADDVELEIGKTASDDDDGADETEQIKEQIAETRSQMGETIDAIQEKLSFANIQEQISEQVSSAVENARNAILEATVGKAASIMKNISNELARNKVSKTVMDNPLPFLLIGAGAGLLIYQGYWVRTRNRTAAELSHRPLAITSPDCSTPHATQRATSREPFPVQPEAFPGLSRTRQDLSREPQAAPTAS